VGQVPLSVVEVVVGDVAVSVGRTGATPVAVVVVDIVEPDIVQLLLGAHVNPSWQHPPPKLAGQEIQFVEQTVVVSEAELVITDVEDVMVLNLVVVCVVDDPTVKVSVTTIVTIRLGLITPMYIY